jgi:type IV secretion system protein VirB8
MDQDNTDTDQLLEHFQEAKIWYQEKYLQPLLHRSVLVCVTTILIVILIIMSAQIYKLLPAHIVIDYGIVFDDSNIDRKITITPAKGVEDNIELSIAKILLENYVIEREKYHYSSLKNQIDFVKINSSNKVFTQYYNFISINNGLSPVLHFQDKITRSIEIIYTNFTSDYSAQVQFRSVAKDANQKIVEQTLWQTDINFEIDQVDIKKANGSKFNFKITHYNIKLLNNEIKN